jgi:hypothetical protein
MKIAFTADSHLDFVTHAPIVVAEMKDVITAWGAEAVCVGGDICHCDHRMKKMKALKDLLQIHKRTYFVLGNHDLWSFGCRILPPDEAFAKHMKLYFNFGTPLETSWQEDVSTVHRNKSAAFVGTIGFPDFMHPCFTKDKTYYDFNGCTNDVSYMKMSLGFLRYTIPNQDAFFRRLALASATDAKDVVVVTHYNILDEQRLVSGDDVAAYFFNHSIGQQVLMTAKEHPDKRFWCLSGHSHEYCAGRLRMASENVYAFGLSTEYRRKHIFFLDTDAEMNQKLEAQEICARIP